MNASVIRAGRVLLRALGAAVTGRADGVGDWSATTRSALEGVQGYSNFRTDVQAHVAMFNVLNALDRRYRF